MLCENVFVTGNDTVNSLMMKQEGSGQTFLPDTIMTALTWYQLLVLLLMSSCDQVCANDSYYSHSLLDRNDSNQHQATSLGLTTTAELQGHGYRSNNGGEETGLVATPDQNQNNICAYYDDNPSPNADGIELSKRFFKTDGKKSAKSIGFAGVVFPANNSVLCASYCFTLWVANPRNKSKVHLSKQGCWLISEGKDCKQTNCTSNQPPRQNNTHFCCCTGYMCNLQFQDVYKPAEHTTSITHMAPVAVVSPQSSSVARVETPEPLLSEFNIDDLKIENVIVRGRYSEIRRGCLGDKQVAVKIYQSHHRQYYYNERNAFTHPFMDHENLVKFYGAKEQEAPDTNILQYIIVTKFIHLGSLTSYLKNNTVDWYTLCHMCQGISRGLAHLHTDIQKGDLFKPAVAHRDLNTRNILLKPDLTCLIADLGFSVGMIGSKIIKNGIPENAEQATLADVGTLRYMAPEVFDGAVNLRDCEASLKQIDVYALGLVIWEISSRCVELYQGAPVPEYQLPFQAEAGIHPAFEEMQVLVVKYKTRPRFPEVWKDANPAVRSLKETIEDCWDTDAEARLTSLCVQERIADMAVLWVHGNKHRGVTPTLNATMNLPEGNHNGVIHCGSAVVSNGVSYLPSYVDRKNEANEGAAGELRQRDKGNSPVIPTSLRYREDGNNTADVYNDDDDVCVTAPLISNVGHLANSSSFEAEEGRVKSWLQDQSVSGSTMDTMLPPTPPVEKSSTVFEAAVTGIQPSDLPPIKASNVLVAVNKVLILHPNQGRNPTAERNTHKRSDEELTVSGNVLVGPGGQTTSSETDRNNRRGSLGTRSAPPNRDGGSFDGTETIESSSLVQNDSLGQYNIRPRNTPIPYFQNHVHGENVAGTAVASYLTRPKLANVSGNRSSYLRLQGEEANPQPQLPLQASEKPESTSLKGKLSKLIRPRDFGIKLSQIVFGGKQKKNQNYQINSVDVESVAGRNEAPNKTAGQYYNSGLDASPVNLNMPDISTTAPIGMEVQMVNGSVVTRACNDVNTMNPISYQNINKINNPQGRLSATNVMRLGVLNNPSLEEHSPSLFTKNMGESTTNDYLSELGREHTVPDQHLVAARMAADYGSMHPIIVNQAYGLDVEASTSDFTSGLLLATDNDVAQTAAVISDNHQSTQDGSMTYDLDSKSLNISNNSSGGSTTTQAGVASACSGNFISSTTSNLASVEPVLSSACDPGILNTVIQSPQNKTISPLKKLQPLSHFVGCNPTVTGQKFSQDISHGSYPSQNSCLMPQNHHTDTKGGNSIMHCIQMEANISQSKDTPRHSGRTTKNSAQLHVATSSRKSSSGSVKHSQTKGDSTTEVSTDFPQSVLQKSSQEHPQTHSLVNLEGYQNQPAGLRHDDTDCSRTSTRDQKLAFSKSFTFSDKARPQSLSLKGHNYNQKRGRSVSSSSLSAVSSLCPSNFLKTNPSTITYDNNRSSTTAVPNVTMDTKSPLIQNSTSRKPATNVAVSTMRSSGLTNDNSHEVKHGLGNNGTNHHHLNENQVISNGNSFTNNNDKDIANCPHTASTNRTNDINAEKTCNTMKDQSDSSEKIRKRIKTPVSFKKGRLSLYDDRLMTQSLGFVSLSDVDGPSIASAGTDNYSNADLGSHSGVCNNGHRGGRCPNGSGDSSTQIHRIDYHKMIKSESDLIL
uniref:receptor protein serine/threonine kinase n=1 Tax=Arion vulgaris TaxID=1028688 RepID=A0A0B7B5C8_9EUPU